MVRSKETQIFRRCRLFIDKNDVVVVAAPIKNIRMTRNFTICQKLTCQKSLVRFFAFNIQTPLYCSRIGYSRGFHVWQIVWPLRQRGTHAVIGVATKAALLHSPGYSSLVGQVCARFIKIKDASSLLKQAKNFIQRLKLRLKTLLCL